VVGKEENNVANEVDKIFEDIGHGIETVFADGKTIAEKLPEYIQVADEAVVDAPTVVKDVTAVVAAVSGGSAIFDALVLAVEGFGTNPTADIAVLGTIVADAPKIGTYWAGVKNAVETLLTTLGADEKQIAAIFAVPAPAPAGVA
jgi:hypothetical protein